MSSKIKKAFTFLRGNDESKNNSTTNDKSATPVQPQRGRKFTLRYRATAPTENTKAGAKRGNDSDSDERKEDLANSITQVLNQNQIGLKNLWDQHNYLPDRLGEDLITEKAIEGALPGATTDLVNYIHRDASKTFVIVLLALDKDERLEAMEAFRFHGFTDSEHLPVPNIAIEGFCEHSWNRPDRGKCHSQCLASPDRKCSARHDRVYDCFHHSCWNKTNFYRFCGQQPSFSLQRFNTQVFQYHRIEDDRVLPFRLREGMDPIDGGFSTVYPATMLAKYLIDPEGLINVVSPTINDKLFTNFRKGDKEEINIAVKVLKPDPKGRYKLEDEWRRESKAHKDLNGLDAHLIKAIAAFQYKDRFCLLLEWADGGSLQSLWTEELHHALTKEGILELLDQLVGLANAMFAMHNKEILRSSSGSFGKSHIENHSQLEASSFGGYLSPKDDNPSSDAWEVTGPAHPDTVISPPAIEVTFSEGANIGRGPFITLEPSEDHINLDGQSKTSFENWRHGDIKPANILRFNRKDIEGKDLLLGTLKLADLGRAKQRTGITEQQRITEIDVWRSEAHEAPDIHVDPNASMSRLYDSWSMGTIIFNIVVWMLYGRQELHKFTRTTAILEAQGSPYWTRTGRTAEVSTMATLWMTHILREDVECNRPAGTAMGHLMKLVKDELLVVGLPPLAARDTVGAVPGQRSNAARLLRRLKEIRNRAHNDEGYLFTGIDRSEMSPPPSGEAAVPEIAERSSEPAAVQKIAARGGLLSPEAARGRVLNTRQRETYTHGLEDKWHYEDDDQFARRIMDLEVVKGANLAPVEESSFCTVCQPCVAVLPATFERRISDLDGSCSLCQMLQDCAERLELGSDKHLVLILSGGSYNSSHTGRPALRVCRAPRELPSKS
jgi:serine/threonine protein kinase